MPDTQIREDTLDIAARAVYAVSVRAIEPALGIPMCKFEELPERDLNLHRDYAKAALEAALSGHVVGWQQAAMAQFIMWCMNEGPWDGCDLHGGDVQDKAEELGLIVKTKFDPKIHGERIEAEEGGDWFVPAEWLLSALPAPPVPEMEG